MNGAFVVTECENHRDTVNRTPVLDRQETTVTRRRIVAAGAALLVIAALLAAGWWLFGGDGETTAAGPPDPSPSEPCSETEDPYAPVSALIDGVEAPVEPMPRDANDVPGVLPLDGDGASKTIAWDQPPGVRPGDPSGNILINAHTFGDGSALGDRFLKDLQVGDGIALIGDDDQRLCYEVTERVEVVAADGFPRYYEDVGSPQVALIVCSGERRGPEDWTHRTIWFAEPIGSATVS